MKSLISQPSDVITPASGNRQNIQICGRTYDSAVPGGYTANHAHFNNEEVSWRQKSLVPAKAAAKAALKAVKAPNIIGDIAVKVQMGTLLLGQKNITMIGVSIYCESSIKVLHAHI